MSEITNEAWRKVASEIGRPTATDATIGMFKREPGPDPVEEALTKHLEGIYHEAELEGAMERLTKQIGTMFNG